MTEKQQNQKKPEKEKKKTKKKLTTGDAIKNASEVQREKIAQAVELSQKLTPDPSKLLSPDGEMVLSELEPESMRDPFSEKADLLKTEWGFYGGELDPEVWLSSIKGYSKVQAKKIVEFEGPSAWREKRLQFQNQALENFAMRSIDTLVEFQDFVAKGAKLSLVRAMEMLSSPVKKIDPATGKWTPGLTSLDVKNSVDAMDKAQVVIMRAMGIHPKEEIGVKIVFDQLRNIQQNQMRDATAGAGAKTFTEEGKEIVPEGALDPRVQTLTNEELWAMIELVREQKKREAAAKENTDE